ncbi:MAG: ABC transporter permease [Elusimicrobiota bacterium]
MIESAFFMALQMIRISIPYILASVGGVFSERSGVINIGLEGIILTGAFCSVLGAYYTSNPWCGITAGIIGGVLMSLIHAIVCIEYRVNQIISGVAVNLLASGITKYFLVLVFNSSSNSERIIPVSPVDLPLIGSINPIILMTAGIVILLHITLFRTKFGLRLSSVGEHPAAADTLGINVRLMKYAGVLTSGACAGLGGAWLAMEQSQFTAGMSNGRGFIALAAMIFGRWTPLGATGAALLFGFAESMQIQLQSSGVKIPTQFIQMIPYVLTIVLIARFVGKSDPPEAAGQLYPE